MALNRRVIVIGMGSIGQRHVRLLNERREFTVEMCEPNPAVLEQARQTVGKLPTHASFDAALATHPQMVVVCTPHVLHAPMTCAALRAGAHVLCEKPMSDSLAGAVEMLKAQRATGKTLRIGFTLRFNPGVAASVMRRATHLMPVVSREKILAASRCLPRVTRLIQLVLAAHHWMPSLFANKEGEEVRILRNSPLVDRAFRHVQANYHQPLSSSTVARSLGYGARYFVRRFATDAGIPFLRFLALYRMAVARHLLRNTGLSIGDVSERVGFQDSNYFTATFTRLNKISPTACRASICARE